MSDDWTGRYRLQLHAGFSTFRRGENLIAVVPRFSMTAAGDWSDTRLPL